MSTTLFKKLFLYWFILIGLWGFGFTQFGEPSIWNSGTPNYSCNTSNDCTVKMIYQCYNAGIQCVNNTSKEWSWWRDPMCSLLGPPLGQEPTKYDIKIIDCWCVNNKCTPKKINKTITNSRIIYKAKKIWIMFLIIVLCTLIPLIIGYKVYKKLKKQKLLPQSQPITQNNWVVIPNPVLSYEQNTINEHNSLIYQKILNHKVVIWVTIIVLIYLWSILKWISVYYDGIFWYEKYYEPTISFISRITSNDFYKDFITIIRRYWRMSRIWVILIIRKTYQHKRYIKIWWIISQIIIWCFCISFSRSMIVEWPTTWMWFNVLFYPISAVVWFMIVSFFESVIIIIQYRYNKIFNKEFIKPTNKDYVVIIWCLLIIWYYTYLRL